ncbi:MAG: hypothetical protein JRJ12_08855 [Deltaproteobacteria bacterium]|nr:hypothetical protein [Deltaproteobacteria bacterium]MBW2071942.1 hypothetical protein [Deltaproteobacteria bacterium]
MAIEKFIGIGTDRTTDVFEEVLDLLEEQRPTVIALDENPIDFSTLIHMRSSAELTNSEFLLQQRYWLLKRELGVGNAAGILYSLEHDRLPIYFVDGSFREPLSETGEEIGIYPYFTSIEFSSSVDMMKVQFKLKKQRIPLYAGWEFDYDLIHAYQTDTKFADMDRAIWQRNAFSARVLNRVLNRYDKGVLAFIGNRKRFRYELYKKTDGVSELELSSFRPLAELIDAAQKLFFDCVDHHTWKEDRGRKKLSHE